MNVNIFLLKWQASAYYLFDSQSEASRPMLFFNFFLEKLDVPYLHFAYPACMNAPLISSYYTCTRRIPEGEENMRNVMGCHTRLSLDDSKYVFTVLLNKVIMPAVVHL